MKYPGWSWEVLGGPGSSWEVLGGPGSSWEFLGGPGRSWEVLGGPGEVLGKKIWHFILGPVPNYLIWVIGVQASLTWLIS